MTYNNSSPERNFSIPLTPIMDNNNFSDFFDNNDFLFSEKNIKADNFLESKASIQNENVTECQTSLLAFCNQVFFL